MKNFTSSITRIAVAMVIAMSPISMWATIGDVNGDGSVTANDVTEIYNYLINDNQTYATTCDVNGDGSITSADITFIYDILLGNIVPDDDENDEALFKRCYASLRSEEPITADGLETPHTSFLRSMWMLNTLSTDEAYCLWPDAGIDEINHNTWDSNLPQAYGLYLRLCANIDLCNSYLSSTKPHDTTQNAEIRTLRAIYYYYLMDLFGNVPTNVDANINTLNAPQVARGDVYDFVLNELTECADLLADPMTVDYGRIDKIAAAMMFARLYLNMSTYKGQLSSMESILSLTYAKLYAQYIINSPYSLCNVGSDDVTAYQSIFGADNSSTRARNEIILPIPFSSDDDGDFAWSGTTYLVAANYAPQYESVYPSGLNTQWQGILARPQFVRNFGTTTLTTPNTPPASVATAIGDQRALFIYSSNDAIAPITDNTHFLDGVAYFKFSNRNISSDVPNTTYASTDFPLMRYAEAPLILAEADARLNNGTCSNEGVQALNLLRTRVKLSELTSANIETVFNERSRELGYEGHRRIDLVRFGRFGTAKGGKSDYDWNQKGGSVVGQDFDISKNIYAIPHQVMLKNKTYIQNPGYDITFSAIQLTAQAVADGSGHTTAVTASWSAITSSNYILYPRYELQVCAGSNNFNDGNFLTFDMGADTSCELDTDILSQCVEQLATSTIKVRIHGYASGTGEANSNVVTLQLNM